MLEKFKYVFNEIQICFLQEIFFRFVFNENIDLFFFNKKFAD